MRVELAGEQLSSRRNASPDYRQIVQIPGVLVLPHLIEHSAYRRYAVRGELDALRQATDESI
jgi:hypothetical protein